MYPAPSSARCGRRDNTRSGNFCIVKLKITISIMTTITNHNQTMTNP